MKTITLKKLEIVEIETIQNDLLDFITYKNATLINHKTSDFNNYFNELLLLDILEKLYYNFRKKIERSTKNFANIILTPSESVVLLMCCQFKNSMRTTFSNFVMLKTSNLLHQELVNI